MKEKPEPKQREPLRVVICSRQWAAVEDGHIRRAEARKKNPKQLVFYKDPPTVQ